MGVGEGEPPGLQRDWEGLGREGGGGSRKVWPGVVEQEPRSLGEAGGAGRVVLC